MLAIFRAASARGLLIALEADKDQYGIGLDWRTLSYLDSSCFALDTAITRLLGTQTRHVRSWTRTMRKHQEVWETETESEIERDVGRRSEEFKVATDDKIDTK